MKDKHLELLKEHVILSEMSGAIRVKAFDNLNKRFLKISKQWIQSIKDKGIGHSTTHKLKNQRDRLLNAMDKLKNRGK
jgi:hypothetical protein